MSLKREIDFPLNGVETRATVPVDMSALEMLRDVLGLTGTKYGCGEGECGACTILVDGVSVNSCLLFAVDCDGRDASRTIEGAGREPLGAKLEQAFVDRGAVQCGFCTPGMVVQARHLLEAHPNATRDEIKRGIEGNLCRCTGYVKIVDAIEAASRGGPVRSIAMKVIDKETLIGKRIAKLDAPEKASGKTRYIHDIDLPGQLHAKILRSTRVHARIRRIDTSRARALPGVHAVITAADVPYQRPIGVAKDHLPLKSDRVRSLRDEIAAVAADSEAIAEAALKLIEVEYEDLPPLTDPADALKPGAPLIHGERLPAPAPHDALKPGEPGDAEPTGQRRDDLRLRAGRRGRRRGRVRRGGRGHVPAALRDALLHGRVRRDRRVRPPPAT